MFLARTTDAHGRDARLTGLHIHHARGERKLPVRFQERASNQSAHSQIPPELQHGRLGQRAVLAASGLPPALLDAARNGDPPAEFLLDFEFEVAAHRPS